MLLPGHIAFGYLASKAALHSIDLPAHEADIALLIGVISSVAPDLDLLYFFLRKRSLKLQDDSSHRTLLSHAPLLWLASAIALALFGQSEFWIAVGLAIWAGSWSHFAGDSIEYGIMWLWPFSKRQFSLRKISEAGPSEKSLPRFYWRYFCDIYARNWTFWMEVTIICLAIFILTK